MRITETNSPFKSYQANVADALVGKEGYAVEQVNGSDNKIQLYTTGPLLGFLHERLEGDDAWNVRLIGKGGTVRCVAGPGTAIGTPAYVKPANGGKVVLAASTDIACGIKTYPGANSADGDFIEIVDVLVKLP